VFRRDHTLPVLDTTGALIGIVTVDDARSRCGGGKRPRATFQLVGGSEELDRPYLDMSPIQMVKRAGWLVVLFLRGRC